MTSMTFKPPADAFDLAISEGRLSINPARHNYAGHYMYMGPDATGDDTFKHIDTRQYLPRRA